MELKKWGTPNPNWHLRPRCIAIPLSQESESGTIKLKARAEGKSESRMQKRFFFEVKFRIDEGKSLRPLPWASGFKHGMFNCGWMRFYVHAQYGRKWVEING